MTQATAKQMVEATALIEERIQALFSEIDELKLRKLEAAKVYFGEYDSHVYVTNDHVAVTSTDGTLTLNASEVQPLIDVLTKLKWQVDSSGTVI